MSSNARFAHFALRVGLAFAFIYPPISALSDPYSWLGYFPSFIHALPIDGMILLHAFGVIEILLGIWILSSYALRPAAAIAALMLLAIVVFNLPNFEVLFRDLSIAAMALALMFWPSTEPKNS